MKKNELIILLVVAIAAVFLLKGLRDTLKNMLAGIGIGTSTDTDKTNEQISKGTKAAEKLDSAWSPLYWKNPPKGKIANVIDMAGTNRLISQIRKAIGYVYDNPEEVIGVFKQLDNKTQVSWLVDKWGQKYGSDLYSWLDDKLDTASQRDSFLQIQSIVKQLPTGFHKTKK